MGRGVGIEIALNVGMNIQVEIRVKGARIGYMSMSGSSIKWYMNHGYELKMNGKQLILARGY